MGRKLVRRVPREKQPSRVFNRGHVAIIFTQYVLLWSSLYVIASTAYLVNDGTFTRDLLPSAVLTLFAGCATILFICLLNITAWRSAKGSNEKFLTSPACLQAISKIALRLTATAWIVASGLAIAFTAARQPFCLSSFRARLHAPAIDVGTQCTLQRVGVAASLLAMISSISLILLVWKTKDPFDAHLLGINKPPELLPFVLPYKSSERPMFSDMSFKCRSTSSFSSYTLVDPGEDTLYTSYPSKPEKAFGLGIYTPRARASAPSFLAPRPSLKSLRSQASLGHRPTQSSPLPPLPVFDPDKYRKMIAEQKRSQPPRRAYTLRRRGSQGKLKLVPRSPTHVASKSLPLDRSTGDDARAAPRLSTLLPDKPLSHDRSVSNESLSSVYSRSISGSEYTCPPHHPGFSGGHSTTSYQKDTPAARCNSPRANRPGRRPVQPTRPSRHPTRSTSDVHPAAGIARLPMTRAVSDFGSVRNWVGINGLGGDNLRAHEQSNSWAERCNLSPPHARKTRQ